ncbi:MAG TPA: TRAM domain-containing protein, partial [Abditibacterium sp.]
MNQRSAFVHFHGLAAGGEAVGRDEGGKIVFAPFAAPGDAAQVELGDDKKAFARGLLKQLEAASPQRTAPPCPQFRPHDPPNSCGGCAWQHVQIEAQRVAKADIVAAALARLGGQEIEVEPCRGGAAFRYRNKADFVIGRVENGAEIGFFARESHDLVPAAVCPIQLPQNEEILRVVREFLHQNPRLGFDAASGRGTLRRLVARVSSQGESLVTLVAARAAHGDLEPLAHALREQISHLVGVALRPERGPSRTIWGRNALIEEVN